jgi:hypothetical protein
MSSSDPDCDNPSGYDPGTVGYDSCNTDNGNTGPFGPGGGPNGSYCDLDVSNNVWVEGVVDISADPPKRGICMLDTMSEAQVANVLKRDPKARCDLPKVTSNQYLLDMLNRISLLSTKNLGDVEQRRFNTKPGGMPYYDQFGGRPPFKPGNSK